MNNGSDKMTKEKFCKYYRVTESEYNSLSEAKTKTQFAIIFVNLGIPERWEQEAQEAIKHLERLTGKQFVIDSKKVQLIMPSDEEIKEEERKIKEGYYTPEAIAERNIQKGQEILQKKINSVNEKIESCKLEIKVLKAVFKAGGAEALNNCIYYGHTQKLAFNWRGYDNLSDDKLTAIKAALKLPKGVTVQ